MKKSVVLLLCLALTSTATKARKNIEVQSIETQVNSLAIPISQQAPQFPDRMVRYGREGYTIIEYDIDAQGEVENAQIIDSEGGVEFVRASLNALNKWRFEPKVVNGSPTTQSKIRVQFDFNSNKKGLSDLIKDEYFHKTTFSVLPKG